MVIPTQHQQSQKMANKSVGPRRQRHCSFFFPTSRYEHKTFHCPTSIAYILRLHGCSTPRGAGISKSSHKREPRSFGYWGQRNPDSSHHGRCFDALSAWVSGKQSDRHSNSTLRCTQLFVSMLCVTNFLCMCHPILFPEVVNRFLGVHYGVGEHLIAINPATLFEIGFFNSLCYIFAHLFIKFSILLFYRRVFTTQKKWFRWVTYALMAYVVIWALACFILVMAQWYEVAGTSLEICSTRS